MQVYQNTTADQPTVVLCYTFMSFILPTGAFTFISRSAYELSSRPLCIRKINDKGEKCLSVIHFILYDFIRLKQHFVDVFIYMKSR